MYHKQLISFTLLFGLFSCSILRNQSLCNDNIHVIKWIEVGAIFYKPKLFVLDTLSTKSGKLVYKLTSNNGEGYFSLYQNNKLKLIGKYEKSKSIFKEQYSFMNVENGDNGIRTRHYYQGVKNGQWEYYNGDILLKTEIWKHGSLITVDGDKIKGELNE